MKQNLIKEEIRSWPDEVLLREIRLTQSDDLINQLYDRYAGKIFRKCISLVKDFHIAEDLSHDVFLKILLSIGTFQGRSKVSTWIYAITYNFCIDYLRKDQKLNFHKDNYTKDNPEDFEFIDDDLTELQQIRAERLKLILEKISVEDKIILLMKYQDDMSIKEIEALLKVSESAIKMRLKRAKEKVVKIYKEMYQEI